MLAHHTHIRRTTLRRLAIFAVAIGASAGLLSTAHGATLNGLAGGAATFTATNGVSNDLSVTFDGANYTFRDSVDLVGPTGVCVGGGGINVDVVCSGVTSLVIDLGDQGDQIRVTSHGHTVTIDGGSGTTDEITASANVDFTLTNASLAVGGSTFGLSGFEQAALTGGASANAFNVGGWNAGAVDLDGGLGLDTLIDSLATGGNGFVLSDDSLMRSGSGPTFTLNSFAGETANLTGDTNNDTFTVSGWSGGGSLDGGASSDSVVSTSNASNQTVGDTQLVRDGSVLGLTSISNITLTGGSSANTIDASGRSTGVTLNGGNGNDILTGTADDDTINGGGGTDTLIEQRDGIFMTLSNNQFSATGETDSLVSIDRATLSGGVAGQTLDAGAFNGSSTLSGEGGDDTLTGGSAGDILDGGPGNDTLAGAGGTDIVRATGITSGVLTPTTFNDPILGADSLSGMNRANLTGTASNDLIDASLWTAGSVTIDGLAGNDDIRGGFGWDTLTGAAGNDSIAGNGGTDRLIETLAAAGTIALSNTSLGGSLGTDVLSGIERATLNGSPGPDQLSATSWTGQVMFDGRADNDGYTIDLAGAGVFSLFDSGNSPADGATIRTGPAADHAQVTATQVARGAETVGLSSIEGRVIDLGAGNDSANVLGGNGTVLGGAGDDTIAISAVAVWGLTVDGGEGSDATSVAFGNLAGPTAISDTGAAGTDSLTTDCTQPVSLTATSVSLGGQTATFAGIEVPPCTAPPAPPSKGTPLSPKPKASKVKCTIRGTKKNDILKGTRKRDVICGLKGDDIILGLKGNDILIGGPGNDILDGGKGKDELQGNKGKDSLIGGKGIDRFFGGAGRDASAAVAKAERKLRVSVERTLKAKALKKTQRAIAKALKLA